MNPVHIYFKEIDIDQNQSFTLNFAKENEIENVLFEGNNEYAVSRMDIKPVIKDEKLIIIENKIEKKKLSDKILSLIDNYKEPDLLLSISNPETKTFTIPFKKDDSIPKKITFINETTQKAFKKNWFYMEKWHNWFYIIKKSINFKFKSKSTSSNRWFKNMKYEKYMEKSWKAIWI